MDLRFRRRPSMMNADNPIRDKRTPELADIFCKYGRAYIESRAMPLEHYKIMKDIVVCRTASLGGHVEVCDDCGKTQNSYNSCRNRHCPKCQALTKAKWLEARKPNGLKQGRQSCFVFHIFIMYLPCRMILIRLFFATKR